MKNEEILFYDSTDDYSKYDKAKQAVYESFYESQDWTNINDVPDDMVWEEIAAQNEADWEYFATALKHRLENDCYIIMGTCGRWNGSCGRSAARRRTRIWYWNMYPARTSPPSFSDGTPFAWQTA